MVEARTNPETRYERADVPLRLVGALAAGLFVFIGGAPLLLLAIYSDSPRLIDKAPHLTPPAPRLQSNPVADLAALRTKETLQLTTYGWADRERGIVHIPLDEAMKRVAARGIPDWPGTAK
jgi:hypothetical protein